MRVGRRGVTVALVTGAGGHLGANVVRALLAAGRRVRALVRADARALDGLDVERVAGDVTRPDSVRAALRDVDVVYHLAGVIAVDGRDHARLRAVNIDGVRHVADAALDARVRRFVHVSSVEAHGRDHDAGIDDGHTAGSRRDAYGRSKAAGDEVIASLVARGLPAVTLRPTGVLGPFDVKPSLMGRFLVGLARGRIPCLVRGGFDWVDARDVAQTALRAETAGTVGERYLVTGHWASLPELARKAGEAGGFVAPTRVVPMGLARVGAHLIAAGASLVGAEALWTPGALDRLAGASRVDGAAARAQLGHRARPLDDTLRDTYAWLRAAGMLDGGPRVRPDGRSGGRGDRRHDRV